MRKTLSTKIAISLACLIILFTGCSTTAEQKVKPLAPPKVHRQNPSRTPLPSNTPRPTYTPGPSKTAIPSITPVTLGRNPMPLEFQTDDGVTLRGYFFPAAKPNAPVVVLMHQNEGDLTLWWSENSGIVPWLQNWPVEEAQGTATPSSGGALPPMPANLTFNVMVFDFRGHGGSGGTRPADFSKFLLDARAAYKTAAGLPLADPNQIIGIGTSIGADAVVDVCEETCRGAFAISPGSWLKVDYETKVRELLNQGKQVRCMYSTNDGPSPETCVSVEVSEQYQFFGYIGIKHGMTFFVPRKMPPDFGQNLLDFLQAAIKK